MLDLVILQGYFAGWWDENEADLLKLALGGKKIPEDWRYALADFERVLKRKVIINKNEAR